MQKKVIFIFILFASAVARKLKPPSAWNSSWYDIPTERVSYPGWCHHSYTTYISFVFPGKAEEFTIERKEVHKIIYKTGKVDILNQAAFTLLDESSWEAVWITEDKKEVGDLYMLGEVEARSPASARSPSAAKKGAIIKLKKKAANMKGTLILVTKKQTTGGYGEYPGYYIKGIAYGPEPPEEGLEPVQREQQLRMPGCKFSCRFQPKKDSIKSSNSALLSNLLKPHSLITSDIDFFMGCPGNFAMRSAHISPGSGESSAHETIIPCVRSVQCSCRLYLHNAHVCMYNQATNHISIHCGISPKQFFQ